MKVGVLQLIDALQMGGAERMIVNLANHLPRDRYRAHLCTTRLDGHLAAEVAPDVGRLRLERRRVVELGAIARLVRYIRQHDIRILHAHSTSVFTAMAAARFHPRPAVIWHDHFGRDLSLRHPWMYRPVARRCAAVIAVSGPLVDWIRGPLGIAGEKVRYIPNFVAPVTPTAEAAGLPGAPGARLVCVANWREQKDHLTLLSAFERVHARLPRAHLMLVGREDFGAHAERVRQEITNRGLTQCVTPLGCRNDVAAILLGCDIGVLSSRSEGLPLALLEYGWAGLPAVATAVGECPEVLDHGAAGILVPPGDPDRLAAALIDLLEHPAARAEAGRALHARVQARYSPERAIADVCAVYDQVLAGPRAVRGPAPDYLPITTNASNAPASGRETVPPL